MLGKTDWLDSSEEPHCTGSHRKVTVIWRGCGAAECCIKKHIHGELTARGEGVMERGCISSRGWLQVEGRQGRGGSPITGCAQEVSFVFPCSPRRSWTSWTASREQRRMNEWMNESMNEWIRVHLTISPRWPTVFAFCRAQSQRPVVEGIPLASLSVRDWLMGLIMWTQTRGLGGWQGWDDTRGHRQGWMPGSPGAFLWRGNCLEITLKEVQFLKTRHLKTNFIYLYKYFDLFMSFP